MKIKISLLAVLFSLFVLPAFVHADAGSEISIDSSGKVIAKNLKVTMVPNPGKSKFFYTRAVWDNIFIRMTVLTGDTTSITKQYGEKATVFDIKEGDIINVEGILPNSADALNIQASNIVDTSLLREDKEVKGKITAMATSSPGFTLFSSKGNTIKVNIDANVTVITKGARTISWSELFPGDTILSIKGTYDYQTDTIDAADIQVYQDKSVFNPKNFQGTLNSISGTALPATIVATIEGKNYTVYLPGNAVIMNKARGKVGLSRFMAGDIIRFYGSIRQTDLSSIDAEVVRNMNF